MFFLKNGMFFLKNANVFPEMGNVFPEMASRWLWVGMVGGFLDGVGLRFELSSRKGNYIVAYYYGVYTLYIYMCVLGGDFAFAGF